MLLHAIVCKFWMHLLVSHLEELEARFVKGGHLAFTKLSLSSKGTCRHGLLKVNCRRPIYIHQTKDYQYS